jgi:hypothetical protein
MLELATSVPVLSSVKIELALGGGYARGLIASAGEHEAAASHGPYVGVTLIVATTR